MTFELTEEQRMIRHTARNFATKEVLPKAAELDETGRFPDELVRQMAELGFMGVAVPEEYGGDRFFVHVLVNDKFYCTLPGS